MGSLRGRESEGLILHSALVVAGAALALVALWITFWSGWAARKVVGRWSFVFLTAGIVAVGLFCLTVKDLLDAPIVREASFGYYLQTRTPDAMRHFLAGAAILLAQSILFAFIVRRAFRGVIRARKGATESLLHVLLLTGVVIFGIPFAWLLVTSFKEDQDMARVPPVWIPQVQEFIAQPENPKCALVIGKFAETDYRGAVLKEFPSGKRTVRILEPRELKGTVYTASAGTTQNVRTTGLRWENYQRALADLPAETSYGAVYLFNTLLLVVLNLVGTLIASSVVGYGFARLRFPGRDPLFLLLLATLMLPGAVTMMPVFLIFRQLGWIDTLYPLWVPAFFGSAFNIFLLRQFFLTVPSELEEAARIDGCSHFRTFWEIMLPQVKPALAAVAIWTFTGTWNNFMGPLIYINSPEKMPVSYALQLYQSAHGTDPGALMAASTMVMLPVVLLFFFAQRYFIEGVTLTGIGGR
jgi:multiple sugar transport system permease protein